MQEHPQSDRSAVQEALQNTPISLWIPSPGERERVQELTQERDYLRALAGTLATGQQRMLEARPRRRWRWPWERRARRTSGCG